MNWPKGIFVFLKQVAGLFFIRVRVNTINLTYIRISLADINQIDNEIKTEPQKMEMSVQILRPLLVLLAYSVFN